MGSFANVHVNTVRRHLRSIGRVAYRPVKSPSLSDKQMKTRLQRCLKYENWTVEEWKQVRSHWANDLKNYRMLRLCDVIIAPMKVPSMLHPEEANL